MFSGLDSGGQHDKQGEFQHSGEQQRTASVSALERQNSELQLSGLQQPRRLEIVKIVHQ